MKVKSLHVHRGYGSNSDSLRGEITFADKDDNTELKIRLDEQLSIEIVHLCAGAIARSGRQAADALTAEAVSVGAIEHQPTEGT